MSELSKNSNIKNPVKFPASVDGRTSFYSKTGTIGTLQAGVPSGWDGIKFKDDIIGFFH